MVSLVHTEQKNRLAVCFFFWWIFGYSHLHRNPSHHAGMPSSKFRFSPFISLSNEISWTLVLRMKNESTKRRDWSKAQTLISWMSSVQVVFLSQLSLGEHSISFVSHNVSNAQTVVLCGSCSTVLCQPTGGICRLTEGCSFRPKPTL